MDFIFKDIKQAKLALYDKGVVSEATPIFYSVGSRRDRYEIWKRLGDWSYFIAEIADGYKRAEKITLVMDNLNKYPNFEVILNFLDKTSCNINYCDSNGCVLLLTDFKQSLLQRKEKKLAQSFGFTFRYTWMMSFH